MESDDGFVSAILSTPKDENLRMVYADWLDDRGDLRGEFLRRQMEWNRSWYEHGEPPTALTDRLMELRAEVDPVWVAVMNALAVETEPFSFWFAPEGMPLTEAFEIRRIKGLSGQPTGLVTFASQFHQSELPDASLAADLVMLEDLIPVLGECYYGSSDFPVYGFMADFPGVSAEPSAAEILTALKTRNYRGTGSGEYYEDDISQDRTHQSFFSHEENVDEDGEIAAERPSIFRYLIQYFMPARMWYVLLRNRYGANRRDAVQFAVGKSPNGNRLLGIVAGGHWS